MSTTCTTPLTQAAGLSVISMKECQDMQTDHGQVRRKNISSEILGIMNLNGNKIRDLPQS